MDSAYIERQVEGAVQDVIGDKAVSLMRGVSKIASKQGGQNSIENYQLLGKRALIAIGVVFVTVQVATWAGGLVISRKMEQKRIEDTVRRVLAEERAKEREYVESKS